MSFWGDPEYTQEPIIRTYRFEPNPFGLWEAFRWKRMDGTDVTDRVLNPWRYADLAVPR